MAMALKILGVSGSLRAGSYSRRAVELTLEAAREHVAETRLLDLGSAELPMFRPGDTATTDVVRAVADSVTWADAFLLATPDYHGSMSGAMKNFLDYHWEEFAGKLFSYICASHEKGLTAMDQMRTAVRQCYGWSLPYGVSIHGDQDFDASGSMTNARVAARLRMLARDLSVYGTLLRGQFRRDLIDRAPETFATRFGH
jgi:NAD(P)H-dependent FMN reductase